MFIRAKKKRLFNKGFEEGYKGGIIATLSTLQLMGRDVPDDSEALEFFFDEMDMDTNDRKEIIKELGLDPEDQGAEPDAEPPKWMTLYDYDPEDLAREVEDGNIHPGNFSADLVEKVAPIIARDIVKDNINTENIPANIMEKVQQVIDKEHRRNVMERVQQMIKDQEGGRA